MEETDLKSKQIEYEALSEAKPEWMKGYNFRDGADSIKEIKQQLEETKKRDREDPTEQQKKIEKSLSGQKSGEGL